MDWPSQYHAILGRPAFAMFMAVPRYVYLALKIPGPKGVIDGVWITPRWEPPRARYDEHNSKSSLSCETKVIEPVGERTTLPKVDAR
jgi:hypothetical protein